MGDAVIYIFAGVAARLLIANAVTFFLIGVLVGGMF